MQVTEITKFFMIPIRKSHYLRYQSCPQHKWRPKGFVQNLPYLWVTVMLMLAQASITKTSMTMYKVETFRHQTPEGNHEKCFYAVKKKHRQWKRFTNFIPKIRPLSQGCELM